MSWTLLIFLIIFAECANAEENALHAVESHNVATNGWSCDLCKLFVKEMVAYVNENPNVTLTEFHLQMSGLCTKYLSIDSWLVSYCEYEIDGNILEFYDVIVKKQDPAKACAYVGACSSVMPRRNVTPGTSGFKMATEESVSQEDDYSFVVISDTHFGSNGDNAYVTWLAQVAINKINSLIKKENIQMVFITGDITDSAMLEQFAQGKSMLDQIQVPYFPAFGNHDVWSYNNSGASTYEEKYPTGDQKFASTFRDIFTKPSLANATLTYNNQTAFIAEQNITCWFQNWELKYKNFVFLALDWNTREHALPGWKGALPTAEVFDIENGTLPWLQQRLKLVDPKSTVVLLQHHPFDMPYFVPEFVYSFSPAKKSQIFQVLQSASNLWGVFAGHLHVWHDGPSGFSNTRQWLTEATKLSSAISLVRVKNGKIADIQKLFGYEP